MLSSHRGSADGNPIACRVADIDLVFVTECGEIIGIPKAM